MTTGTTMSGLPLQTGFLTTNPTIIPMMGPDGKWGGKFTKIEWVIFRGPQCGARLHVWLRPDERPHNHPWEYIDCVVLRGQYRATEHHPDGRGGFVEKEVVLHADAGTHRVMYHIHHRITEVVPGTVSIMSFGPQIGDGKQWGNLPPSGSAEIFVKPEGNLAFVDALRHCNPHIPRPADWSDPYADQPVPDINTILKKLGLRQ